MLKVKGNGGACLVRSVPFFNKLFTFIAKSNRNNRPGYHRSYPDCQRNCSALRNVMYFVSQLNLHIALVAYKTALFLSPQLFNLQKKHSVGFDLDSISCKSSSSNCARTTRKFKIEINCFFALSYALAILNL